MKHKLKLGILLVILLAVMAAIFLFSAQSAEESKTLSNGLLDRLGKYLSFLPWFRADAGNRIRKLAHFAEFSCLGLASFLFFGELFFFGKERLRCIFAYSSVFCFLYSCSDEIHQIFVPGRSCEWKDILIDSSGALLGIFTAWLFVYLLNGKAGNSNHEDTSP